MVQTATQANVTPEGQHTHTLESEQSWTQKYKQLKHSFPKFGLKLKMEMQYTEWAEGKNQNKGKYRPQQTRDRQTDSQTDRDGLQRALSQCNS